MSVLLAVNSWFFLHQSIADPDVSGLQSTMGRAEPPKQITNHCAYLLDDKHVCPLADSETSPAD